LIIGFLFLDFLPIIEPYYYNLCYLSRREIKQFATSVHCENKLDQKRALSKHKKLLLWSLHYHKMDEDTTGVEKIIEKKTRKLNAYLMYEDNEYTT
jgi:hypothetical protein